jgi:hypothetical protein
MLKKYRGYLQLADVVVFFLQFQPTTRTPWAILHEFQRIGVVVVPAAADDDNCAFAGSNSQCPSGKNIGGGG